VEGLEVIDTAPALEKSGHSRGIGRPFVKGDPRAGRPKGRRSDAQLACEQFAREVISSPEYRESVWRRVREDSLPPAVECLLHHYAYGKPVDRIEVKQVEEDFSVLTPEFLQERFSAVARILEQAAEERASH
jgi:hypothetical protein